MKIVRHVHFYNVIIKYTIADKLIQTYRLTFGFMPLLLTAAVTSLILIIITIIIINAFLSIISPIPYRTVHSPMFLVIAGTRLFRSFFQTDCRQLPSVAQLPFVSPASTDGLFVRLFVYIVCLYNTLFVCLPSAVDAASFCTSCLN